MIRVLLADDHALMRRGIRDLLQGDPAIEVVGEAADGREATQLTLKLKPDVLIMDLTMPELNGLDAIKHIRRDCPDVEVLVFSMHDSEELIREVFSAGARGYVLKSDAALYLIEALKTLAQGRPFFTPRISEAILHTLITSGTHPSSEPSAAGPLSSREREILQLLAENKTNKEIATRLGISVRTVETHRRSVMQKLNANSIVELVHYAIRNGIVQPSIKLETRFKTNGL